MGTEKVSVDAVVKETPDEFLARFMAKTDQDIRDCVEAWQAGKFPKITEPRDFVDAVLKERDGNA